MLEINSTSSHSLRNKPTVLHPPFRVARAIRFINTFIMVRIVKDLGSYLRSAILLFGPHDAVYI